MIEDDETNKSISTIIKVITSNLPRDIKAYQIDNNLSIKLYPVNTKEQYIKEGKEDELLGEIKIEAKEDIFIIKVEIINNNNACKFCLKKTDPLRIYKIIAYLNDFLSYDE